MSTAEVEGELQGSIQVTVQLARLDLTNADNRPVRGRLIANLQGLLTAASVDDDDNPRYDPGPIDGVAGGRTRRALINFKRDNGLRDNAIVGRAAWERLIED